MQHPRIMIASIGVAVVAAAGGITAASVGTSTASAAPAAGHGAASHSAAAATVRTAQVPVGGRIETILTTSTGQPLELRQARHRGEIPSSPAVWPRRGHR